MKRLAGMIMTALLSASVCVTAFGAVSTDAAPWAAAHMEEAYAEGLISDTLMQKARSVMTRADFCDMVVTFYEKVTDTVAELPEENPFLDCNRESVQKAYQLGMIAGIEEGIFRPEDALTREQLSILLVRMLEKCGMDLSDFATETTFSDTGNLQQGTQQYLSQAYSAGLLSGYGDNTFRPKQTLTVQEAVTAFLRAYHFYEQSGNRSTEEELETAEYQIEIGGKQIALGQTAEQIQAACGAPARIDEPFSGLQRYIYTTDGKEYFFVTFQDGQAVEIFTPIDTFLYQSLHGGISADQIPFPYVISSVDHCAVLTLESVSVRLPLDYENQVCGILLQTKAFAAVDHLSETISQQQRICLETELLEILNARRMQQGCVKLAENEDLSEVSYAHSNEMAQENYFDYNSLDGRTPFERMQESNLSFHTATEVIARSRGEVVQLYAELIRSAAKNNSVFDNTVTQVEIGIANRGKTLYATVDLYSSMESAE